MIINGVRHQRTANQPRAHTQRRSARHGAHPGTALPGSSVAVGAMPPTKSVLLGVSAVLRLSVPGLAVVWLSVPMLSVLLLPIPVLLRLPMTLPTQQPAKRPEPTAAPMLLLRMSMTPTPTQQPPKPSEPTPTPTATPTSLLP